MRVSSSVLMLAVSTSAFTVNPVNRPPVSLHAVEPAVLGVDRSQLAAAGAAFVALVGAGAAAFSSVGKISAPEVIAEPEPEPEPVDVSIPYDAAPLLAYDTWRIEGEKGDYDQATYEKFKAMYLTKTVAEVTAKKVAREMALL